ncbi:MAG TPA: helicase-related protein, partial [Xanthobacteraceae bacterium]|nr:helicase-related protein [Xanthobacteraceae bacterium]
MPLSFSSSANAQARAAGAGVTAVLGPTNTGKTHLAIERMVAHSSGLIGLPLRLLAREVYNKIVEKAGADAVALVTGEEKIKPPNPRYWVSTVEAMPRDLDVAFVAIDEVQLGADLERGHVFTDRMLHRRGREETLVLGAQTLRPMIEKLLPGAHILSRPRLSQLTYAGDRKLTRLPRRSAIVTFSAEEVYAIGELIRRQRGGVAVVLGSLSPRTRNAQVALYQAGEVEYLVATDAIGMGLNLDVDHVAFAADRKFDGYQFRRLNPAELAQIAGRAGRATRDGSFGTTGRCEPFEPELVHALESHSFEPLKLLQWRNTDLEFSTIGALQASLAATPTAAGLTRAPIAEDIQVLEHAARDDDVRALATSRAMVERLWEVCQVPDYRKISPSAHTELAITLFGFLAREGTLPIDWFARQVAMADRADGDIDTLSTRIAHIRTWTFAANRPDWLADPEHWQGVTRAVEDKLSDALHERLLHRFVDRRTSVLMRRLRENAMLETEISKTGEVLVEGHSLGRLEGFRFAADADAGGSDAKALRSAAQKALAGEINTRAARLAAAGDEQFLLASDGTLRWLGDAIGRLAAGEDVLKPQVRIIADEQLTGAPRDAVQARLDLWIGAHIEKMLGPLVALSRAEDVTGIARGIAFQLVEALGVLERQKIAEEIKGLDQAARASLRKYGVRFGAYHIYLPQLLKPAPRVLALQLWAVKQGSVDIKGIDELPQLAATGRTSLPADKEAPRALYRTIGYRVCGERAVRVDILERLADIIRPALAWRPNSPGPKPPGAVDGSSFAVTGAMTSLVGSSGEDFASVLRSLGYRMERRPKPPEPVSEPPPAAEPAQTDAVEATVVALGTAPVTPEAAADAGPDSPELLAPVSAAADAAEPPASGAATIASDEAVAAVLSEAAADPQAVASPVAEATAAPASAEATQPAAAADAAAESPAEPDMIEVWRPGRFDERRPPRSRAPHRGQRARSRRDGAAALPAAMAAEAAAPPAEIAAAPSPEPLQEVSQPAGERRERPPRREDRREGRRDQPRDQRREGRRDERRDERGPRGRRFGKDAEREDFRKYAPKERRDQGPDPNSPFAKLLALKEQLEANKE